MNAPVLSPGGRIDEKQPIKAVRIAVLTISDTRDEESDTSGHVLAERVKAAGHELADKAICRDSIPEIREKIEAWVASGFVEADDPFDPWHAFGDAGVDGSQPAAMDRRDLDRGVE